jgi:hypothetical protein
MKTITHFFSLFVILFFGVSFFLAAHHVRAEAGSATLGGTTEMINTAITPSGFGTPVDEPPASDPVTPTNLETLGGSRASGLVPCGNGEFSNAATDCKFDDIIKLVKTGMNFLLFVLAVPISAIMFAYAGWLYMSSGMGGEGNIKKAHEVFSNVVLGLSIALAAWLIVNAIIIGLGVGTKYNFLGTT